MLERSLVSRHTPGALAADIGPIHPSELTHAATPVVGDIGPGAPARIFAQHEDDVAVPEPAGFYLPASL